MRNKVKLTAETIKQKNNPPNDDRRTTERSICTNEQSGRAFNRCTVACRRERTTLGAQVDVAALVLKMNLGASLFATRHEAFVQFTARHLRRTMREKEREKESVFACKVSASERVTQRTDRVDVRLSIFRIRRLDDFAVWQVNCARIHRNCDRHDVILETDTLNRTEKTRCRSSSVRRCRLAASVTKH